MELMVRTHAHREKVYITSLLHKQQNTYNTKQMDCTNTHALIVQRNLLEQEITFLQEINGFDVDDGILEAGFPWYGSILAWMVNLYILNAASYPSVRSVTSLLIIKDKHTLKTAS